MNFCRYGLLLLACLGFCSSALGTQKTSSSEMASAVKLFLETDGIDHHTIDELLAPLPEGWTNRGKNLLGFLNLFRDNGYRSGDFLAVFSILAAADLKKLERFFERKDAYTKTFTRIKAKVSMGVFVTYFNPRLMITYYPTAFKTMLANKVSLVHFKRFFKFLTGQKRPVKLQLLLGETGKQLRSEAQGQGRKDVANFMAGEANELGLNKKILLGTLCRAAKVDLELSFLQESRVFKEF